MGRAERMMTRSIERAGPQIEECRDRARGECSGDPPRSEREDAIGDDVSQRQLRRGTDIAGGHRIDRSLSEGVVDEVRDVRGADGIERDGGDRPPRSVTRWNTGLRES
jgi:hypothetical protein